MSVKCFVAPLSGGFRTVTRAGRILGRLEGDIFIPHTFGLDWDESPGQIRAIWEKALREDNVLPLEGSDWKPPVKN